MKIRELILFSSQLSEQENFYKNTLGMEMLDNNENEISFQLKNSVLKFVKSTDTHPYHFAFTIPSNKINKALAWLKERVQILKDDNTEIVDFPSWNAESIYFYDADKNILEFIVRKNLHNSTTGSFEPNDILEISEIGLATGDFDGKFQILTSIPGVEKFSGGKEVFSAIGSERGLFILVDKNKKNWFPSHDKAFASAFIANIETENNRYRVKFEKENLSYEVLV